MAHNKRILRARISGAPVWDQLLSGTWALARRKSASRYATGMYICDSLQPTEAFAWSLTTEFTSLCDQQ